MSLTFNTCDHSSVPSCPSGEAGAAVLSELQADLHAGGRPRTNTQHQGAAPQIRPRARTVQRRLRKSQKVRFCSSRSLR